MVCVVRCVRRSVRRSVRPSAASPIERPPLLLIAHSRHSNVPAGRNKRIPLSRLSALLLLLLLLPLCPSPWRQPPPHLVARRFSRQQRKRNARRWGRRIKNPHTHTHTHTHTRTRSSKLYVDDGNATAILLGSGVVRSTRVESPTDRTPRRCGQSTRGPSLFSPGWSTSTTEMGRQFYSVRAL